MHRVMANFVDKYLGIPDLDILEEESLLRHLGESSLR